MSGTSNKQIIRNPQMIAIIQKIKRSRIKLDIVDLTKFKKVTAKAFWTQLDFMIDLNFESSSRKKEALEYGLEFGVILPGVSQEMNMIVFFNETGSIKAVGFDHWDVHYTFTDMILRSKIRSDVEIETT